MDFTSENWEQLGQGQGDLFWDTALDNYWNLFLLNPPGPNLTFHPDGGEKLEALVKESPESTDTDMWDLSCLTRLIKPTSPTLEDEVSTTGPSGKSPRMNF
ncbi:zinc finger protein 473 isoform X2 [Bos indicus]|uniref:Zinc finger protein 473 isoform X2 n=1 Tax=Bos indicus TaxID=9915 RepID=A0ABM4QYC7_BOSIN